jgi:hypothetical protein
MGDLLIQILWLLRPAFVGGEYGVDNGGRSAQVQPPGDRIRVWLEWHPDFLRIGISLLGRHYSKHSRMVGAGQETAPVAN